MPTPAPRIIWAADGLSSAETVRIANVLGKRLYAVKIHDLFDRDPLNIGKLREAGVVRVWVDAKLHDIPETVRRRCEAMQDHGASIVSVHASGGLEMLQAALASGINEVYAITALTSLSENEIQKTYGRSPREAVKDFALTAAMAGAHGIVCSPLEVKMLRAMPELRGIKLITPGIRMPGQDTNDQERIGTPEEALRNGADYLVTGRPITQAPDPAAALDAIEKSLRKGFAARIS